MNYLPDFPRLLPYQPDLLAGLMTTVWLTVLTTTLGILGAVMCVWQRHRAPTNIFSRLLGMLVELLRNTPFIVQLFFIFFGLPALGLSLSAEMAAVIAMTLNLAAYSSEILRAGVDATGRGQWEAGRALGLTRWQSYRHVVLMPALERMYPALTSQCVIVMLGSSVVSQISVADLTFAANFIQSRTFLSFESYVVTAGMYLLLAIAMRALLNRIGRRLFGFRHLTPAPRSRLSSHVLKEAHS